MNVAAIINKVGSSTVFELIPATFTLGKKINTRRIVAARIGVNAKASLRGADQVTLPLKDHCIGNLVSSDKRSLASHDMKTNMTTTAMLTNILAIPYPQITLG
ncbi:MAG: hypothetical protein WA954_11450 [Parerythrobacter sp.]